MKRLVIILLTSLFAICLSGQEKPKGKWSGDAGIYGGTNFQLSPVGKKSHNVGGFAAGVGYSEEKFDFRISNVTSYDHLLNGSKAGTMTIEVDTVKAYDVSANETTNLNTSLNASLGWNPNRDNSFSFNYAFSYNKALPNNFVAATGPIDDVLSASFSKENSSNDTRSHDAGFGYRHLFNKPGRDLQVQASAAFFSNNNFSDWVTGDVVGDKIHEKRIIIRKFRDTPETDNEDFKLVVNYTDKRFVNVKNLDLRFGLTTRFKIVNDHKSSSNYVDGEWRDSTSAREDFRYSTMTVTPSVKVNYKLGFYKLDATLSPELFSQKLDSGTKIGEVCKEPFAFIASINNTFNPWEGHNFGLNYGRSISRPSYLQVCWFPRVGNDANEVYVGNQSLRPSITNKFKGSYKFSKGRFSTGVGATYTYKNRKIEKTYSDKEIEGRKYRVYTWINGGESNETSLSLNVAWDGESFNAGIEGYYNIFNGLTSKGSASHSTDYGVNFNAGYHIKTWTFSTDMAYQSDVVRSYNSLASRIVCNARISKQLGKFEIYLDGKDLFDQPIIVKTMSEDETQFRYEESHYNRRLFVLGVNFVF